MSVVTGRNGLNWATAATPDWDAHQSKFKEQDGAGVSLAVASLIIGLFGLCANSQIFRFYWSKKKDLVPSLYLVLSATDTVVSLTAVLHFAAMLLLVTDKKESPEMKVFLGIVYTMTTLILRVSVFVNVVLIVVRTINITKPFYMICKKGLWVAIVIFPLGLLPIILNDAYRIGHVKDFYELKVKYVFLPYVGDYTVRDLVFAFNNVKTKKFIPVPAYVTFLTSCLPFILAVMIALVCLVLNARELRGKKEGLGKTGDGKMERDITVTIAMLTVVFSLCNIVYTVFLTLRWIHNWDYWDNQLVLQLCYVTSTIFPFVSSALNPVILILRSKNLRQSLVHSILRRRNPTVVIVNPTISLNTASSF